MPVVMVVMMPVIGSFNLIDVAVLAVAFLSLGFDLDGHVSNAVLAQLLADALLDGVCGGVGNGVQRGVVMLSVHAPEMQGAQV